MKQLNIFLPITKIDATQRLVYGILAEEALDKAKEIFDYDSSKPNFEKWSDMFQKMSDGQSLGNVRAMHNRVAAGKLVELNFDDTNKQITACAKVTDDNEWAKVEDHTYNGFSVGGRYAKRWLDPKAGAMRYTAEPNEVSLVDNPCMYGAQFTMVKMDGSEEFQMFDDPADKEVINSEILAEVMKALEANDLAKAFSYEEIREFVSNAIRSKVNTSIKQDSYAWVIRTYDNYVIAEIDNKDGCKYYSVPYSVDSDGAVTLGQPTEVVKKETYEPVVAAKSEESTDLKKGEGTDPEETPVTDPAPVLIKIEAVDAEAFAKALLDNEAIIDALDIAGILEKRGARNNKNDASMIQTVHDHAVKLGAACSAAKVEEVPATETPLAKTEDAETLAKAVETINSMKGIVEGLQKTVEGLTTDKETLSKKVEQLEAMPAGGGPVLKMVDKTFGTDPNNGGSQTTEVELLAKMVSEATDPLVKQTLSQELAMKSMRSSLGTPVPIALKK